MDVSVQSLTLVVSFLLLGAVSSASVHPKGGKHSCQCVPDQWQGVLASVDREFDLRGGRTGSMENQLYVSYDFKNKMFAMTDLKTGNRAIADYRTGHKYVIRNDECRGINTGEKMRQMCLPEHAEYLGEFRLGTDIPVDFWQFSGPFNVSMKTTVIQKNCVPITEDVYMVKEDFASLTSSMYLDITLGIKDKTVFEPPVNCMVDFMRGPPQMAAATHAQGKRVEGGWNVLNMLKHDMYQD